MIRFKLFAVPFGSPSQDLGGFVEVWTPSAVRRTIDERRDLRALKNHDSALVLGRIAAGTMRVRADARGLHATVDADESISYVSDLSLAVQRRDVSGASFAFRTIAVEWAPGDPPVRRVVDAEISELSVVTFPAFLNTHVSVGDGPRSVTPQREVQTMRLEPLRHLNTVSGAETEWEFAAPRTPQERRELALAELAEAQTWWVQNPGKTFTRRYAPPHRSRAINTAGMSLAMLRNFQKQVESTL